MIFANMQNKKKQLILWPCITTFYKKYLQNLKYNVIKGMYFYLILVSIPPILILSLKNRGGGDGGFFV